MGYMLEGNLTNFRMARALYSLISPRAQDSRKPLQMIDPHHSSKRNQGAQVVYHLQAHHQYHVYRSLPVALRRLNLISLQRVELEAAAMQEGTPGELNPVGCLLHLSWEDCLLVACQN